MKIQITGGPHPSTFNVILDGVDISRYVTRVEWVADANKPDVVTPRLTLIAAFEADVDARVVIERAETEASA